MKQFLKYLFSILALSIVLLYLCDYIYTQTYLKSNPRNKLQYLLNTKNEFYDVAFLGSSRVANHIDVKLFDSLSNKKTINLGVEGAGLNDNLLQLKLLINNNKVSNICLQIDSNFENISPSNISISEAMPFLKNEIIKNHLKDNFNNFNKLAYLPFYRYAINDPKIGFRELFFSVINKKPKIDPSIGYTPKYGKMIVLNKYELPKTIKKNNIILNEIIQICNNNNIKLTLFTSPFCLQTKNINYIAKLKNKIPALIDLSKGYNDKYFSNCGHLNNEGAKIFTANFYNVIKDNLVE